MFRRTPRKVTRLPKVIEHGDYLFITPTGSARMVANILFTRGEGGENIFVDCGTQTDPGIPFLKRVFARKKISLEAPTVLLLTHHHLDHTSAFKSFRALFPNLTSVCPEAELPWVKYPFRSPPRWGILNRYIGRSGVYIFLTRTLMKPVAPLIYGGSQVNPVDRVFSPKTKHIRPGNTRFSTIWTPGHSPGHTIYIDEQKTMFLGDLVPGTPWLHPTSGMLAAMIESVQRLLALSESEVTQVVRSHCNTNDHGRFVYPWAIEKARFQKYLELIFGTLDNIPKILRGRELTLNDICARVINKYARYSRTMNKFFIPPGVTWVYGYLDYLTDRNQVQQVTRDQKMPFWTS